MGCGLSSHIRTEDVEPTSPVAPQTFYPFGRLPYELRWQIWTELLSQETPRAYSLLLDPRTFDKAARVDFMPAEPAEGYSGSEKFSDLVTATFASRILGSTCREARDAVAFVLPNTFPIKRQIYVQRDLRIYVKSGSFRFHAKQDIIIILESYPSQLEEVLKGFDSGHTVKIFQSIEHLALDVSYTVDDPWLGRNWSECHCGRPGCKRCFDDPLPRFLTLFPRLNSFHIAQATTVFRYSYHGAYEEVLEPVQPCNCGGNGQSAKHHWPVLKGMGQGTHYISYVEDTDCPFPTLRRLAFDRERCESRWPYYDSLSDIDLRILRRVSLSA